MVRREWPGWRVRDSLYYVREAGELYPSPMGVAAAVVGLGHGGGSRTGRDSCSMYDFIRQGQESAIERIGPWQDRRCTASPSRTHATHQICGRGQATYLSLSFPTAVDRLEDGRQSASSIDTALPTRTYLPELGDFQKHAVGPRKPEVLISGRKDEERGCNSLSFGEQGRKKASSTNAQVDGSVVRTYLKIQGQRIRCARGHASAM